MIASRRSALLVTLAALTLAGCGGGGGGGGRKSDAGPEITGQPADASVALGGTATFAVEAKGSGTLAYRWYKGATALDVAGPTLTLPDINAASAGSYFCRVTDDRGSKDSRKATLTVAAAGAPTLTAQPKSLTVGAGGQAVFTVVATGDGLTYQWYRGATPVAGATDATLTVDGVSAASAGSYTVRVTNAAGTVTSAAATLTLASTSGPVITGQPQSQIVALGKRAVFAVTVTGTGLRYQWQKDGNPIDGATDAVYAVPSAALADAGTYRVVVSNGNGSATSADATLSVAAAPGIRTGPQDQAVYLNASVTFSVEATGQSLKYQWQRNAVNIDGATGPTYTVPRASLASAGIYSVSVFNVAGSARSQGATLTVYDVPTITTPPASATLGEGQTATLKVIANGQGALTYQWAKNGVPIPGATGTSYTTPALAVADSGVKYRVAVTNPSGTRTSPDAVLTVVPAPTVTGPQAVTVTAPATATFTVTATAKTGALTYQWYRDGAKIKDATEASYTTAATTKATDDGAKFYCVVTNSDVIATKSAEVRLTVQ